MARAPRKEHIERILTIMGRTGDTALRNQLLKMNADELRQLADFMESLQGVKREGAPKKVVSGIRFDVAELAGPLLVDEQIYDVDHFLEAEPELARDTILRLYQRITEGK